MSLRASLFSPANSSLSHRSFGYWTLSLRSSYFSVHVASSNSHTAALRVRFLLQSPRWFHICAKTRTRLRPDGRPKRVIGPPSLFQPARPIGIRERCLSGADHARKARARRQQLQCKLGSASVSSNDHQSLISPITAEPSVQVFRWRRADNEPVLQLSQEWIRVAGPWVCRRQALGLTPVIREKTRVK